MCDNTAVTWGNYDTVRSQIEYNVRHKIYEDIKALLETSKEQKISDHFIAGLECAMAHVLGLEKLEKEPDAGSVLF
jgi:hypothetical protein